MSVFLWNVVPSTWTVCNLLKVKREKKGKKLGAVPAKGKRFSCPMHRIGASNSQTICEIVTPAASTIHEAPLVYKYSLVRNAWRVPNVSHKISLKPVFWFANHGSTVCFSVTYINRPALRNGLVHILLKSGRSKLKRKLNGRLNREVRLCSNEME